MSATRAAAAAVTIVLVLVSLVQLSIWSRRDRISQQIARCSLSTKRAADHCEVVAAFQRGLRALNSLTLYVGEEWFLQQLLRVYPDEDLRRRVQRAVADLSSDPSARVLNPSAPLTALPADPGRGIKRLSQYVLAPAGAPPARAVQYITDFVARDESGYALTHQLLVLEWARATGLDVPAATRQRREMLLRRIAAEQSDALRFTDLFVERTACLIMFGSLPRETVTKWVDVLVAAQLADGSWVDRQRSPLEFDGQRSVAIHPPGHTTALAVTALGFFLDRY